MDKNQFSQQLKAWLEEFLSGIFSSKYSKIEVVIPDRDLKRLNHPVLKEIGESHAWEFKPDLIAILKGDETRVVLVNRSISAISLKEIGEMYCYAKLANPLMAMVVSPKAASSEVNGILLDKQMQRQILNFSEDNQILVLGWNEKYKDVDKDSIIPLDSKSLF